MTRGATPARAQYMFFDTNGDQVCAGADFLWGTDIPIDVYLDSNHNVDGSPAACSSVEALTIGSYELIFRAATYAGGAAVYGAWTNAIPAFTTDLGRVESGEYLRVGFSGPVPTWLTPGKYKLGTLVLTSTPCTILSLVASMPGASSYFTGFFSECVGADLDNNVKLGLDFFDFCGVPQVCDDVKQSTWGRIKNKYR